MILFYDCPNCGEEVPVRDGDMEVECLACNAKLIVDYDADFVGDGWKDLTKLIEKGNNANLNPNQSKESRT